MRNPLHKALYARLAGDATLTTLGILGVYHRQARQGKPLPYIIYQMQVGIPWYTLARRGGADFEYMVKAVVEDESDELANDMDARCDVLLNDQLLTIPGFINSYIRRIRDVSYPEIAAGGRVVQHIGGIYRIEIVIP